MFSCCTDVDPSMDSENEQSNAMLVQNPDDSHLMELAPVHEEADTSIQQAERKSSRIASKEIQRCTNG